MSSNNTSETVFIGSDELEPKNQNTSETMYVGETEEPSADSNAGETMYLGADEIPQGGNQYTDGTVYQPEGQTAPPVAAKRESQLLNKGTMVGEFMVMEPISTKGKESVVYRAERNQESYALKLYKRELRLSEAKMNALMQIQCPYVAKLCAYGTYEGQPYEVYPYYKNGTIENKGKIEGERLKHYINQLNEALHSLHTASGVAGMVHGDLKPSNIFLSDDEGSLILGDFGVSNMKVAEGSHFARICGTPEFAPPSAGLMDQMRKTPAYDYGALGLVAYYLATGYSYFVGCTAEQIAESWEKGIVLPEEMETRIKMLLEGLLQFDENRRFGYADVHDWYKGSFVQVIQPKRLYTKTQAQVKASLWFGIFDGQVVNVTSIEELVAQMKKHWEQAGMKLRDTNFYGFVDKFYPDGGMTAKIKRFLVDSDLDSAVFKTIYTLSDNAELVYKEKKFGSVSNMIQAVADQDPDAKELINKGLFLFYIEAMGYSAETYQAMQEILSMRNGTESFRIRTVGYMFAPDKSYKGMTSIDQLRTKVCSMTLEEIDQMVKDEDFMAWLYVMGLPELSLGMAEVRGDQA